MRYPSKYVLITDVDTKSISEMKHNNCNLYSSNSSVLNKKSSICDNIVNSEISGNDNNNNNENMDNNNRDNYAKVDHPLNSEMFPPKNMMESSTIKSLSNIPMPTNACNILPEKTWQDAIMSQAFTAKPNESKDDGSDNATSSSLWDFSDPLHKVSCVCIK